MKKFKTVLINWNSIISIKKACSGKNIVIHTAGLSSEECKANPNLAFEFNSLTSGFLGVASQYEKVNLLINLSSIHVYSKNLDGIINEDSATKNSNIYAKSKKLTEHIFQEISISNQTKFINLRLSNVFGYPVNNNQNCWKLFINNICKNAVEKKVITIKSNPLENRNFISISFLNKMIGYILERIEDLNYFEIFNITSDKTMTLEEITFLVRERYQILFNEEIKINFKLKKTNCKKILYSSKLANCTYTDKFFDIEIKDLLYYCKNKFS